MKYKILLLNCLILFEINHLTAQVNSGNCLSFNGGNSAVSFGNNNLELNNKQALTVMAWVKWNNKQGAHSWANMITLNNSQSGDDGQFWLQHNQSNTAFEFALQTSSRRVFTQSTTNPQAGLWYHLAGVYDGSKVYIYVNGIPESNVSITGNINVYQNTYKFMIGQWANTNNNTRSFNGMIDEVSIWSIALTQSQIQKSMCSKLIGNEPGLIGLWHMNERTGNRLIDETSNGRNGLTANTTQLYSGAPLGDESVYVAGGTSASLSNPYYHDSIVITNFSSSSNTFVVYRVDTLPNTIVPPATFSSLLPSYYFGCFVVGSPSASYDLKWYYKGHPGITNFSKLALAVRDQNDSLQWTNIYSVNNDSTMLIKTGLSGRKEFILGELYSPLPIELLFFHTQCKHDTTVHITWTTASEVNNDYFTILRSKDGINWEETGKIAGAGNSNSPKEYEFDDVKPMQQNTYYRLKQTDYDGKSKIYALGSVLCKYNYLKAKTFPNPVKDIMTLSFFNKGAMLVPVIIEIYNSTGKLTDRKQFSSAEGQNEFQVNLAGYQNGTYFIQAKLGDIFLYSNKVVVQK